MVSLPAELLAEALSQSVSEAEFGYMLLVEKAE
jgi:hypothetical protein